MSEDKLRGELIGAFKARAMIYYRFFEEMRQEFGEEAATTVMRRAIYKHGLQIGEQFKPFAPDDFEGLKNAFLDFVPDQGSMFSPTVERCDEEGLDIKMHRCPLKSVWLENGIGEEDVAKLTRIAGVIDDGTFEGAGFSFSAETWQPGREGCCHLHIRSGKKD